MNILEQEDIIKGMPDSVLQREARMPSGQVPQYLVVSEIQRRTDMRKKYQAQQPQPQTTVAEQVVNEGISGLMPQPMQQPMQQPSQAPMPPAQPPMAPMMPQRMRDGGVTYMQEGGETQEQAAVRLLAEGFTPEEIKSYLERMSPTLIDSMVSDMSLTGAPVPVTQGSIPYGLEFAEEPRSDFMNLIPRSDNTARFNPISLSNPIDASSQMDMRPSGPKNVQGTSKIQTQATPTQVMNQAMIANDRAKDIVPQTPVVNPLTAEAMMKAQEGLPQMTQPTAGQIALNKMSEDLSSLSSLFYSPDESSLGIGDRYRNRPYAKRSNELPIPEDSVAPSQGSMYLTPELADMYGDIVPSTASDEGIVSVLRSSGVIPSEDSPVVNAGGVDPDSLNLPDYSSVIDETTLPSRDDRKTENAFADLIEQGRRDAMSQALIQLGAGIAGGDLAGGISRAGEAAYKVRQDARAAEASRLDKEFLQGLKKEELRLMELRLDRALTDRESVALNNAWEKATVTAAKEIEGLPGLTAEARQEYLNKRIRALFLQGAQALGVAVPDDYMRSAMASASQAPDLSGLSVAT